jgi:hypothetical protein
MLPAEQPSLFRRAVHSLEQRERRIQERRKDDRRKIDDHSRVISLYEEQQHDKEDEE